MGGSTVEGGAGKDLGGKKTRTAKNDNTTYENKKVLKELSLEKYISEITQSKQYEKIQTRYNVFKQRDPDTVVSRQHISETTQS